MQSVAKKRRRRAAAEGRKRGFDQLAYETARDVCAASTPAAVLAELGGSGNDPREAAALYARTLVAGRFRAEAEAGCLEGFGAA